MYNEKINNLENRMVEIFGENASFSVTNARLGRKGYLTRIESCGLPFRIDSREKTSELSEQTAINEFEKQLDKALAEKLFPTQKHEEYENIELTPEELDKLYKYMDQVEPEILIGIKKETKARICCLSNNRFECVIDCLYINLHARSDGATKKLAIAGAIWNAHDILTPLSIRVGDWWIGSEELEE